MTSLLQACALFLLISICRAAEKPSMEPEGSDIALNEGDRLLIKCHSDQEMNFYTKLNHPDKASDSDEESTVGEGSVTRSFEIKSVVPEDSGWYGCAVKGVTIDIERFDQPEVKWIYVGVKPKKPSMEQLGPILNLVEGDELFIKCRSYQDMTFYIILDKSPKLDPITQTSYSKLTGSSINILIWFYQGFLNTGFNYSQVFKFSRKLLSILIRNIRNKIFK
ncbi:uncharacterized protein LOC130677848 isoform X2 [Microplitis mediator]|uniref:uncharacterized protein LOC130677848 isoform X2 n=1 Tax=Microplitis mediator TaxID=375433 RepID=UPI0025530996|nr:uncharacterized protein LOC130677848 isoform X2 [Microplitis mediator]